MLNRGSGLLLVAAGLLALLLAAMSLAIVWWQRGPGLQKIVLLQSRDYARE